MNEIVTAPSTTSELGENRKGDPTAPKSQALVKKLKDFISEGRQAGRKRAVQGKRVPLKHTGTGKAGIGQETDASDL